MPGRIRWGIIGPGTIAKEFTDDLGFINDQEHSVKAIVGHRKETTEEYLAENPTDLVFYNIDDLIKSKEVDCVYIATPHLRHHEACIKLLQAGIPVLCEKPLAVNEKQVSEIIKKANETRTFFMEGMWIRCLPSIIKVLEIIQSGKIGKINSITGCMTYKAPFNPENRYFNPELGGGSLLDLGVYPIFLSHIILGKPEGVKAHSKIVSGVDGGTAAIFSYKSGAYAVIESSFIKKTTNEATIFGELGSIHISEPWNEKPQMITIQIYEGEKEEIKPEWKGKGLYFEVVEMVKCIEEGKIESNLLPHNGSLELIQIMDEIRKQVNVRYPNE